MLKTAKFGGSSLAAAEGFRHVKAILQADPARRAVTVSAPGKRFKGDNKVTDLLYLFYAHIKYGVDYRPVWDIIRERYRAIAAGLELDIDLEGMFAEIENDLKDGAGEEYLVSRGEYLNARLMAAWLGYDFADAKDCVFLNFDDSVNKEKTYAAIRSRFSTAKNGLVLPGFYGSYPDGRIALMSRGGSDITGALMAAALEADIYENWTDVPGILMADPGIVKDPQPIPQITYTELRELSYMGAKVLHEASVFPVREAGIPLNIRDTGNPEHPGTFIAESFECEESGNFFITGITGRKDYTVLDIRLENIARNTGAFRDVLKLFENCKIALEQVSSGVDAFSLIVQGSQLKPHRYAIIAAIEGLCGQGSVKVSDGVSLIACVSRSMVSRPGISGLIFGALGREKINIRTISQDAEELCITIGVADGDFDRTIRTLYDSFTRKG